VRGHYYNTVNFTDLVFFNDTPTINFDWGFGSPGAGLPADGFAVRWTGRIAPTISETYTFFATVNGGVRIWLEDQLILDRWFEQGTTEWGGTSLHLTAGSVYNLRVDYFD